MKHWYRYTLVFLVTAILASCSGSGRDKIINKYWRIKSLKSDKYIQLQGGDSTNNVLENALPCFLDNRYAFRGDGKVLMNEYTLKCDSLALQEVVRGTWQFSNEETFMFYNDTVEDFEYVYTIEVIDDEYFRASYPRNGLVFTIEYEAVGL